MELISNVIVLYYLFSFWGKMIGIKTLMKHTSMCETSVYVN